MDNVALLQFTDAGDIFLQGQLSGEAKESFFVVQKGQTVLRPVFDCTGTVVLPYCTFHASVAPNGDMQLFEGGIGSRKVYSAKAGGSYPITAVETFSLPEEVIPQRITLLGNSATLAEGNDGGYGSEQFFIRRSGATEWQHAPEAPGFGYVFVAANRQGQLFFGSRQLANGTSIDGNVYRMNY